MKCRQFHPVLMSSRVPETAAFYVEHFGFKPLFDSGWYVHLQSTADASINLAVLETGHATIPATHRQQTSAGLLLNFEVDDVDAEYARLAARGLPVLLSLRDEAFGQRHFITQDPNGVLIDVIKSIPLSAEFQAFYLG